jgi:two-component system, chemotaxis family, sensor kinase CheA
MQVLGGLHLKFKEISECWKGHAEAEVASLCAMGQGLLEKVILAETSNAVSDLAFVAQITTLLQALILEERSPQDLAFPPGFHGFGKTPTHGGGDSEISEEEVSDPDPSLTADFVRESKEHLEAADVLLMTLESEPGNIEAINAVFRGFHTIKGVAGFLGFRTIQAFAHETENLLDLVRTGKIDLDSALLDVVFAAADVLKKRILWVGTHGGAVFPADQAGEMRTVQRKVKAFASGMTMDEEPAELPPAKAGMRLGEILVESGMVPEHAVGEALKAQADAGINLPLGEVLVRQSAAEPRDVALALRSQKQANDSGQPIVKETVKVEADRLDKLLDTIGELVIAESMIFQSPELKGRKSPALTQQMVLLDKITRELQKMGTSLRMVPIRPVFQKMARLVRDLSRKAGKEVEFQCFGDETELDKTVVDKIGDPLIHMVRNSVDHGIEPDQATRIEAGKPVQAKVILSAFQKGGNVCIQIEDDGKGLNREAILRKARERGLLKDDGSVLSDQEVWRFIFEAGFSTAAQVTEISGRGVGMDVVRRNIEELRGRIEIESKAGVGTTFSIWLPLTLAIIDGMIVRVGRERFVFPTLSILRIVPLVDEEVHTFEQKGEMLLLQGELIPLFRLDSLLGSAGGIEARRLAIIVESGCHKAGLLVDELLGQQQVVIKGLGETMKRLPGVSGGAILSDGTVGIILDVDGIIKSIRSEPAAGRVLADV